MQAKFDLWGHSRRPSQAFQSYNWQLQRPAPNGKPLDRELNDRTPGSPETCLDEHGTALYRHAMALTRDPHRAEEAAQETLLAALQARERFAGNASVRSPFAMQPLDKGYLIASADGADKGNDMAKDSAKPMDGQCGANSSMDSALK